jgi:hypothetical protein
MAGKDYNIQVEGAVGESTKDGQADDPEVLYFARLVAKPSPPRFQVEGVSVDIDMVQEVQQGG